jgi:hypothetical protein
MRNLCLFNPNSRRQDKRARSGPAVRAGSRDGAEDAALRGAPGYVRAPKFTERLIPASKPRPNATDLTQWDRDYQLAYAQVVNKPMCERGARYTMLPKTVENIS